MTVRARKEDGAGEPSSASSRRRPRVGITMGDPAGVGPELSLRMLSERAVLEACVPAVYGDAGVLEEVASRLDLAPAETVVSLAEWRAGAAPDGGCVIDCGSIDARKVRPGRVDAACGLAAFAYIRAAVECALVERIAAVATAPIHKESLRLGGIPYPGHTEMLADLTGAEKSCMMLASDELVVSMVTTHIGLRDVASKLSTERIFEVIELTASAMERRNGRRPKIGVCALNPHGGEHGLFGAEEEERFILPAIERARAQGHEVEGPFPPDTAFLPEKRRRLDAVVCMYHDQGHIPLKTLAFDKGVNITLGLPIVRTSVDHGTAFDIAWTGRASPVNMIEAVVWAARMAGQKSPR